MNEKKLKTMAIAHEFSLCHGYGVPEDEVDNMWDETRFEEGEVDTKGIGAYEGNSTSEIANMIVLEILKK